MSYAKQKQLIENGEVLAPFFEVKVEIRVFGHLIWSFVFPPKKNDYGK